MTPGRWWDYPTLVPGVLAGYVGVASHPRGVEVAVEVDPCQQVQLDLVVAGMDL
jgi:hypothetical protein